MSSIEELEAKAAAKEPFSRADAEAVLAMPDLIRTGVLAESSRRMLHGNHVTFGRVLEVRGLEVPSNCGSARELRLVDLPDSVDATRDLVRRAARAAGAIPLTGFSLADLIEAVGFDEMALADLARDLRDDGLEAVAEVPVDRLDNPETAAEIIRAVLHGGLKARRATITRASAGERLDLIERAAGLQRETNAFSAFAPLPRVDPQDQPSTGYDDVRTIAVTRLVCTNIPSIQVDWPLYGPKLAQVAIAYGADDIDGVSAMDTMDLGPRRAPREDIVRQIQMAAAEPVERNGRYERLFK